MPIYHHLNCTQDVSDNITLFISENCDISCCIDNNDGYVYYYTRDLTKEARIMLALKGIITRDCCESKFNDARYILALYKMCVTNAET